MKKCYTTILFDLDGTVLDTSPGLLKSIDETIKQCGLHDIDESQKISMIGPPIDQSLKNIYSLSDIEAEKAAAVFRKVYSEKFILDAEHYPGIIELMHQLHEEGWKLGVATYKRNDYAQLLMQKMGINSICDFTLGSDGKKQTKADIIQICLKELGCENAEECIMVGDTIHDYEGAVDANTGFVGVTYGFGFHTCEEIMELGAMASCDTAEEMKIVFEKLLQK